VIGKQGSEGKGEDGGKRIACALTATRVRNLSKSLEKNGSRKRNGRGWSCMD
jgi:hypothetical protein